MAVSGAVVAREVPDRNSSCRVLGIQDGKWPRTDNLYEACEALGLLKCIKPLGLDNAGNRSMSLTSKSEGNIVEFW